MNVINIILNAAKVAHVSGNLLLAICAHESGNFTLNYSPHDHGSPSIGVCQIKESTARLLGFKGNPKDLMDPKVNSLWAAKYLKYQQKRYGDDWVRITAAYNSGSYNPSKIAGCPRNLHYIKKVREKLPVELRYMLDCGNREIAGNLP